MKTLLVYNVCGLGKTPDISHYNKCIDSFLDQDLQDYRVLLSSCKNNSQDIISINKRYGNSISYVHYSEPHTVNITFNRSIQEYVKQAGEADSYMFIDSGCSFDDPSSNAHQNNILKNTYNTFKKYIISLQVDTDEALHVIDPKYTYQTSDIQVVEEDLYIPLGCGINCHATMFSNELYKAYNNKVMPDVFAAYCTESTFRYLAAAIKTKWYVMKDQQIRHIKDIEGASLSQPHHSPVHHNPWNNLLYNRNALDFINNEDVRSSGLGYEECNNVLSHNSEAYDDNDMPLDPANMISLINKYFFLSNEELNYDNIKIQCKI